jgi:hypothetical protein
METAIAHVFKTAKKTDAKHGFGIVGVGSGEKEYAARRLGRISDYNDAVRLVMKTQEARLAAKTNSHVREV